MESHLKAQSSKSFDCMLLHILKSTKHTIYKQHALHVACVNVIGEPSISKLLLCDKKGIEE